MANQALGAPRLPGPQPVAKSEVAANSGVDAEPLLKTGDSHVADSIFHFAMLGCGLCVLALVGLIIYELMSGSRLSWHAFGLKFFFRSEWDPVNEQFGALPFVYGTLVSSLLALLLAVPLAIGVAVFITEMCPR
jgi:phosphate transport system permease protein